MHAGKMSVAQMDERWKIDESVARHVKIIDDDEVLKSVASELLFCFWEVAVSTFDSI